MKPLNNGTSLTLLGLIIAAIGVVSPIAWDWWNKRTQITIEKKSNVSIVSISQPVKNLELLYNGKKISELRKINLIMRNTGKTPVTKEDVISPLTLTFSADEILEVSIARKHPNNLNASTSLTGNALVLGFDLFNPGDEAEIEALIAGGYEGFSAAARIKNITSIDLIDASTEAKTWKNLSFGAYVSGFFGLLFFLSGITMLLEIPRKRIIASTVEQGASPILNSQSLEEAKNHLKNDFGFLTGVRSMNVRKKIDQINYPINASSKQELSALLVESIRNEDSLWPAVFSFIISGIASWYVIAKIMAL